MKYLIPLSPAVLVAWVVLFGRSCFGGHFILDSSASTDIYHLSAVYERLAGHLASGHFPVYRRKP